MLKEIIEKCSALGIYEKRNINDEYCELVFYNKETAYWLKIITDILGSAAKPQGIKPIQEHLRLTKDYGGIYAHQTLFKKEFGNATIIAMLWPWGDRTHTTLKIAILDFS